MIFRIEDNWKKELSNMDEAALNELLHKTASHRNAYSTAEEVKIAQLWCALLETRKERDDLDARLKRLEFLLDGFLIRANQLDAGKRKAAEILEKF
jgi:hypothetical protein